MEAALSEMMRVTDQLRSMGEELTELRRQVGTLDGEMRAIAPMQASLDTRLGTQATVLRGLHTTVEAQALRLEAIGSGVR